MLIERGADIDARDQKLRTAQDYTDDPEMHRYLKGRCLAFL